MLCPSALSELIHQRAHSGRNDVTSTPIVLAHRGRVVAFGCDLTSMAPAGLAIERWDDVPAVSEDYGRARDVIAARVRGLVDQLRQG